MAKQRKGIPGFSKNMKLYFNKAIRNHFLRSENHIMAK